MSERRKQIQLAVEKFISLVRDVDGVIEVALFGSAASEKPNPKDFDLMVFIEDTACIPQISKSIRKTTHIFHAMMCSFLIKAGNISEGYASEAFVPPHL